MSHKTISVKLFSLNRPCAFLSTAFISTALVAPIKLFVVKSVEAFESFMFASTTATTPRLRRMRPRAWLRAWPSRTSVRS